MIKSMTGYGAGKYEQHGKSFAVEIKSVNHKYGDLSVKLPKTMLAFEELVRKIVSKKISRGKVDIFINYESAAIDDNSVIFNETLGDNLYAELCKIKTRYKLEGDITVSDLCRFPGIITVQKNDPLAADSELWPYLEKAVNIALDSFVLMREKEGAALQKNLLQKAEEAKVITSQIEVEAPFVVDEYKEKLMGRLKDMIIDNVDTQRIAFEIALFADKCSIDEELTRLKSHAVQLGSILNENIPIGKKLDFIVQEMLRETNTIGSKSNNINITNLVIKLKTLIEQIREQIQNIE